MNVGYLGLNLSGRGIQTPDGEWDDLLGGTVERLSNWRVGYRPSQQNFRKSHAPATVKLFPAAMGQGDEDGVPRL